MHPPATIEGAVFDAVAQCPAVNVVVSAQAIGRWGWYQTRTDGQGRYRLRTTKDHYNIWADADDRIAVAAKAVKAEPGETAELATISLVRGGFVTGRVLDRTTKAPVRPANQSPLYVAHYGPARPRTGVAVTSTRVNPDGTYRLRVAPGKNRVYVMSGDFGSRVVNVEDGQELPLDLGLINSGVDDGFAADIQFANRLRREAEKEDRRDGQPRGAQKKPRPPEPIQRVL